MARIASVGSSSLFRCSKTAKRIGRKISVTKIRIVRPKFIYSLVVLAPSNIESANKVPTAIFR